MRIGRRHVLALVSAGLVVCFAVGCLLHYFSIQRGMDIVKVDTAEQVAIERFFDKLENIGEMSLVLIGALWTLFVYGESRVRPRGGCEWTLFASANLHFAASFLIYFVGTDFLVSRLFYHSSIDLDAPIVSYWRQWQLVYFVGGLLSLVASILVSLREKEKS
jgi:hypothetical protein